MFRFRIMPFWLCMCTPTGGVGCTRSVPGAPESEKYSNPGGSLQIGLGGDGMCPVQYSGYPGADEWAPSTRYPLPRHPAPCFRFGHLKPGEGAVHPHFQSQHSHHHWEHQELAHRGKIRGFQERSASNTRFSDGRFKFTWRPTKKKTLAIVHW